MLKGDIATVKEQRGISLYLNEFPYAHKTDFFESAETKLKNNFDFVLDIDPSTAQKLLDRKPKNKKTFMSKLNTMMKKLLDADTQALVTAGFLNEELEFTDEGKEALIGVTFDAYKAQLVAVATAKIAEAAAKK